MPGYRRFVAYVYEYRKGRKEENCGFLRVEAREEQCRIEVNIKCPGLPADTSCEVRGIVRMPSGVRGVKIGTVRTFQDGMQSLLTCETDNMDQDGTGLADLGGMILITEGGAFFGTEWDDIPIVPEDFMAEADNTERSDSIREVDNTEESNTKDADNTEEPDNIKEVDNTEEPDNIREADNTEKTNDISKIDDTGNEDSITPLDENREIVITAIDNPELEQNIGRDVLQNVHMESIKPQVLTANEKDSIEPLSEVKSYDTTVQDQLSPESEPFPMQLTETSINNDHPEATTVNGKYLQMPLTEDPMEGIFGDHPLVRHSIDPSAQRIESQDPITKKETTGIPPAISNISEKTESPENPTKISQRQRPLPGEPFEPFTDGEITDCRKLHPQDLRFLSPYDRPLRNNRFLSHGYYNFGYILLGKTAQNQYILGVPGGYDQQERFMASMYGFPYFKESPQIRLRQSRGGYWYRLINTPNFHHRNRPQ